MKAALIGYGWWGQHLAPRIAENENMSLAGICAPELTSSTTPEGYHVYPDYEAVLADETVDAVILTSPNQFHEPQTVSAAAAGKHVFCEKPFSLDGASARRMAAAIDEHGVQLAIGHERRFEPGMRALSEMVETGALGTIMHAEAAFSHDKLIGVPLDNWRTKKTTAPAAGMTGMGIHLTDAFIGMFGPVEVVQALTADRVLGWETGDLVSVQLGFKAGMTATLSAILKTPHFIRCHVFGSDRWAEVRNDTHPDTPGGFAHLSVSETGKPIDTKSFPWEDTVVHNLEAFAAAIDGRAPYPIPVSDMVHNIEVLEAIAQAAETRETVRL
jgi:predicted dehydrogenase